MNITADRAAARGCVDGYADSLSTGVLTVLNVRGIGVSGEVYDRIAGCTDLHQLGVWIRRAAWVDSAESLFV